ncbi:His-Xaa-Ser system radical SAM maturase HxsB [Patescibacteria group bacterium]|nr:His-Xaa-Ser system radical SAM maturase HxsB [Patescibacteria group bacterium]MBU2472840.1 His-Xaa-Ser system radical SAM maturase HxsB [Patescibacteria group bacterium]
MTRNNQITANPGFFRFKKVNHKYLLTNETGDFIFLKESEFDKFVNNKLSLKNKVAVKLNKLNFLKQPYSIEKAVVKYRSRNNFLFSQGPSLHIIVLTLRCNHSCLYCQAASCAVDTKEKDLDKRKAKKIVDFIFSIPSKDIAIEFQGGEPLLNWPVLKFIIDYACKKNKTLKKNLQLRLVSNFSLLDESKLKFFFDNNVSLCTSLDGPREVHDKNRILFNKQSHKKVSFWLKRVFEEYNKRVNRKKNPYIYYPGAVLTVSRHSLKYPREIVDEYVKWGFNNIPIRPVNSFGLAKERWKKVGYSSEEFLRFYKKVLNYIISLNQNGVILKEAVAGVMLQKILTDKSTGFLDLRSPCGAGIGQLLYNYDGSIYSCDEGRMVGDDIFKLGDIEQDNYQNVITGSKTKSLCLASCLENNICDLCVYKPYCGTCPVDNYVIHKNIFVYPSLSDRCKINKGIFDYLFTLLQNQQKVKVLKQWIDKNELLKI